MATDDGLTELTELEDNSSSPTHVYEHQCAICNEHCYRKPSSGSSMSSSSSLMNTSLLKSISEAFDFHDIHLASSAQDEIVLCPQCTFHIGSLKTLQCHLREVQSSYEDAKAKIAFAVMGCLSNNRVGDIYDSNMSLTAAEKHDGTKADTLQCLIYMSWKKRYILQHQREMEAENGRANNNVTEVSGDKGQLTTAPRTASGNFIKRNGIGKMAKSLIRNRKARKKNSRSFLTLRGSRRARKDRIRKKEISSVTDGNNETGVVENEDVQPAEDEEIVETEEILKDGEEEVQEIIIEESCQNPGDPEEITMAMSPELFQKNGYAVTDYSGDSEGFKAREEEEEGSDKSVSIGQLSPGERALLNGTFELIGWVNKMEGKESSSGEQSNEAVGNDNSPDSNESKRSTNGSLAERLRGLRNEDGLYVCVFCSKAFRHKYPFRDHVKTHTGDAPTCSVCNKIFPKHHNLMLHMRTHTGEKPYKCEACGKGFADKSNLKVHMRAHTGERPYRCEFCNMGFVNSSRLVVHRRLHTGERPFTCGSCDESFCTKNQLQYHLKKVHLRNGTFYRCQHCSKHYMSAYSLRSHLKKFHVA